MGALTVSLVTSNIATPRAGVRRRIPRTGRGRIKPLGFRNGHTKDGAHVGETTSISKVTSRTSSKRSGSSKVDSE
jgi:hypothetical protein